MHTAIQNLANNPFVKISKIDFSLPSNSKILSIFNSDNNNY